MIIVGSRRSTFKSCRKGCFRLQDSRALMLAIDAYAKGFAKTGTIRDKV